MLFCLKVLPFSEHLFTWGFNISSAPVCFLWFFSFKRSCSYVSNTRVGDFLLWFRYLLMYMHTYISSDVILYVGHLSIFGYRICQFNNPGKILDFSSQNPWCFFARKNSVNFKFCGWQRILTLCHKMTSLKLLFS